MKLRTFLTVVLVAVMAVAIEPRVQAQDSLLGKLKRLLPGHRATPTPTPTPEPHKKRSPAQKKSTPSPSPSIGETPALPSQPESTASPVPTETPAATSPTASPEASVSAAPESAPTVVVEAPTPLPTEMPAVSEKSPAPKSEYFEPVRPLSPPPGARPRPKKSPVEGTAPAETTKKTAAPTSTVTASEISGYDSYPEQVRKVLDLGLDLTNQNLSYKYNSADPAKGGMDCSGFIQYLLSKSGINDVPRDARDQYVWARKADNFQAVLSQRDDTFELDALKPGDLLFWANTSGISHEPEVTETMIYLGREKGTNQRLMVGASEGGTLKGQKRVGVGVFDFKLGRAKARKGEDLGPVFVGYAHIPGVSAE
jgi:cell wall-associated NlpC family hydrolase